MSRRLEWTVPPEQAGTRVDTLLRNSMGLSGTVIRRIKWLEDGILADGRRVNTRYVPAAGQVLSVRLSDPERRSGLVPRPGPIEVVYEDADLIVLNKAPGISVHPGPGHYEDTIGNFLLYYYDSRGEKGDFHPIHRLDRGTSGLMVVAKHPYAQECLKQQLHTPEFCRVYLAVCEGKPGSERGVIDQPIGAKPGSLMEQMVCPEGKPARTHYETIQTVGTRTLLRLVLETGRTHQIRVHMAYLGHPLIGDFLYGVEDQTQISRPALHSSRLSFRHPIGNHICSFEAPLPKDMGRLLVIL